MHDAQVRTNEQGHVIACATAQLFVTTLAIRVAPQHIVGVRVMIEAECRTMREECVAAVAASQPGKDHDQYA
jgi:hypothetical protein